ncbi:MAG: hypothetical protein BWY82_01927 [Verrucomicrobia bacterium ADurb.Bin474]|nr:MAG: hypothetical protein BWY82_01927 [Verrucomicrobia bacterium ADurb.Bin474]
MVTVHGKIILDPLWIDQSAVAQHHTLLFIRSFESQIFDHFTLDKGLMDDAGDIRSQYVGVGYPQVGNPDHHTLVVEAHVQCPDHGRRVCGNAAFDLLAQ